MGCVQLFLLSQSDYGSHISRRIFPNSTIATVMGIGFTGYAGDGGSPLRAREYNPTSAFWDGSTLWVTEVIIQRVNINRLYVYLHESSSTTFHCDRPPITRYAASFQQNNVLRLQHLSLWTAPSFQQAAQLHFVFLPVFLKSRPSMYGLAQSYVIQHSNRALQLMDLQSYLARFLLLSMPKHLSRG